MPKGIPLPGDRAAWNADGYPLLHTNDTDTADGIHHTLGSGATQAAAGDHGHAQLHDPVTVADTSSIDLTVSGQSVSGVVLPGGVDHNSLANLSTGDYLHLTAAQFASLTTLRRIAVNVTGGVLEVGAGAAKIYNLTGAEMTITRVHLAVGTAPSGAAIIVDVNIGGTTIFTTQSNRPQIAAAGTSGESTTIEAGTLANGAYLTVDIDQVGSGPAGADLVVSIVCN